jgi:copper chaperone
LVLFVVILAMATDRSAALERITLKLEGLTSSGCSSPAAVRGTMKSVEGVSEAEVSLERGEAVVELDPAKVDLAWLATKVERFCQVKVNRPPGQ